MFPGLPHLTHPTPAESPEPSAVAPTPGDTPPRHSSAPRDLASKTTFSPLTPQCRRLGCFSACDIDYGFLLPRAVFDLLMPSCPSSKKCHATNLLEDPRGPEESADQLSPSLCHLLSQTRSGQRPLFPPEAVPRLMSLRESANDGCKSRHMCPH